MESDLLFQRIMQELDGLNKKIDDLCDRTSRSEQKSLDSLENLKMCQERKDRNYKIGFSVLAIIFSTITLFERFMK